MSASNSSKSHTQTASPPGGRDAVARAFTLWADCDGEHAVDALARFEPQPSIVIASGSGRNCHAYWPLTEPLGAGEIERANRRLAHALDADPRIGRRAGGGRSPQR